MVWVQLDLSSDQDMTVSLVRVKNHLKNKGDAVKFILDWYEEQMVVK